MGCDVISLGAVHTTWKHCDPSEWWELHSLTECHIPDDWNLQDVRNWMEQSAIGIFQALNKFAIFNGTS